MNRLIAFALLNFVIIEIAVAQDVRRDENVKSKIKLFLADSLPLLLSPGRWKSKFNNFPICQKKTHNRYVLLKFNWKFSFYFVAVPAAALAADGEADARYMRRQNRGV